MAKLSFVIEDGEATPGVVPDVVFSRRHVRACVDQVLAGTARDGHDGLLWWTDMGWISQQVAAYLVAHVLPEEYGCIIEGSMYDGDALWEQRDDVPPVIVSGLFPAEDAEAILTRGFRLFAGPAQKEPRAVTHLVFFLDVWSLLARKRQYDFSHDPDGLRTSSKLLEHKRRTFRSHCPLRHWVQDGAVVRAA